MLLELATAITNWRDVTPLHLVLKIGAYALRATAVTNRAGVDTLLPAVTVRFYARQLQLRRVAIIPADSSCAETP